MREILFLDPVLKHNIWGGRRLTDEFGYNEPGDDIGECWGISAHPNGDGTVRSGSFGGMTLSEVYEKHPEIFGSLPYDRFPLMIKLIDAQDDLSIQVHPDDKYAAVHENGSYGKTESWYILDCPPDATLVMGHNAKTREELIDMVRQGRWSEFIREVPVKKGDLIQIDPGTVHAIKGGILLAEIQQSSDVTYRVYDYDRLSDGKPRELHIDKSIDVINVPATAPDQLIKHIGDVKENELVCVSSCRCYEIFTIKVDGTASFSQDYPFMAMTVTEGSGTIDGYEIKKGDNFIISDKYGTVRIDGKLLIIAATVRK